jgi:hypothetical protein
MRQLDEEREEYAYCRLKYPCELKELIRAKLKNGLLYVVCHNPEGCNQKTLYPVKIDLSKGDQLTKEETTR